MTRDTPECLEEKTGFRSLGRGNHTTLPSRVAGKSLLFISAGGMSSVLVALWEGRILGAAALLLLTFLVLDILLQRAVTQFHATRSLPYTPRLSPAGSATPPA